MLPTIISGMRPWKSRSGIAIHPDRQVRWVNVDMLAAGRGLIFPPRAADDIIVTTANDLVELEIMLGRFNRLIGELARGAITRNNFAPWEIELLVDIDTCK